MVAFPRVWEGVRTQIQVGAPFVGLDEHFDDGDVFEVANVGNLDFNGGHGESPVLRRDEKGRKAKPCG